MQVPAMLQVSWFWVTPPEQVGAGPQAVPESASPHSSPSQSPVKQSPGAQSFSGSAAGASLQVPVPQRTQSPSHATLQHTPSSAGQKPLAHSLAPPQV